MMLEADLCGAERVCPSAGGPQLEPLRQKASALLKGPCARHCILRCSWTAVPDSSSHLPVEGLSLTSADNHEAA